MKYFIREYANIELILVRSCTTESKQLINDGSNYRAKFNSIFAVGITMQLGA